MGSAATVTAGRYLGAVVLLVHTTAAVAARHARAAPERQPLLQAVAEAVRRHRGGWLGEFAGYRGWWWGMPCADRAPLLVVAHAVLTHPATARRVARDGWGPGTFVESLHAWCLGGGARGGAGRAARAAVRDANARAATYSAVLPAPEGDPWQYALPIGGGPDTTSDGAVDYYEAAPYLLTAGGSIYAAAGAEARAARAARETRVGETYLALSRGGPPASSRDPSGA